MPAHVKTAGPAEGDAPPVSCKPGVLFGRIPQGDRTRTGREGMEIKLDARRVYEGVFAFALNGKKLVGMGDQATATAAAIDLGTVSTDGLGHKGDQKHGGEYREADRACQGFGRSSTKDRTRCLPLKFPSVT